LVKGSLTRTFTPADALHEKTWGTAAAVYVLHAFQKKSTRGIATPQHQVELIKQRLKAASEHARGAQ
jgi:hypothetical protein